MKNEEEEGVGGSDKLPETGTPEETFVTDSLKMMTECDFRDTPYPLKGSLMDLVREIEKREVALSRVEIRNEKMRKELEEDAEKHRQRAREIEKLCKENQKLKSKNEDYRERMRVVENRANRLVSDVLSQCSTMKTTLDKREKEMKRKHEAVLLANHVERSRLVQKLSDFKRADENLSRYKDIVRRSVNNAECTICLDDCPGLESYACPDCSASYCHSCLVQHAQTSVSNFGVRSPEQNMRFFSKRGLRCPHANGDKACKGVIPLKDLFHAMTSLQCTSEDHLRRRVIQCCEDAGECGVRCPKCFVRVMKPAYEGVSKERLHKCLDRARQEDIARAKAVGLAGPVFESNPLVFVGYAARVERPMWFSKMAEKIEDGAYATVRAFTDDMDLIVRNCWWYNGKYSRYGEYATAFAKTLAPVFDALREEEGARLQMKCHNCELTICTKCGSEAHDGQTCEAAAKGQRHLGITKALIAPTAKSCPSCGAQVLIHFQGHACHNVKCPNCFKKCCVVCLQSPCVCDGSIYCSKNREDIVPATPSKQAHMRNCGCCFCPDCAFQKPCSVCNGSCFVCQGIVKPGPKEICPPCDDGSEKTSSPGVLRRGDPLLKGRRIVRVKRLVGNVDRAYEQISCDHCQKTRIDVKSDPHFTTRADRPKQYFCTDCVFHRLEPEFCLKNYRRPLKKSELTYASGAHTTAGDKTKSKDTVIEFVAFKEFYYLAERKSIRTLVRRRDRGRSQQRHREQEIVYRCFADKKSTSLRVRESIARILHIDVNEVDLSDMRPIQVFERATNAWRNARAIGSVSEDLTLPVVMQPLWIPKNVYSQNLDIQIVSLRYVRIPKQEMREEVFSATRLRRSCPWFKVVVPDGAKVGTEFRAVPAYQLKHTFCEKEKRTFTVAVTKSIRSGETIYINIDHPDLCKGRSQRLMPHTKLPVPDVTPFDAIALDASGVPIKAKSLSADDDDDSFFRIGMENDLRRRMHVDLAQMDRLNEMRAALRRQRVERRRVERRRVERRRVEEMRREAQEINRDVEEMRREVQEMNRDVERHMREAEEMNQEIERLGLPEAAPGWDLEAANIGEVPVAAQRREDNADHDIVLPRPPPLRRSRTLENVRGPTDLPHFLRRTRRRVRDNAQPTVPPRGDDNDGEPPRHRRRRRHRALHDDGIDPFGLFDL